MVKGPLDEEQCSWLSSRHFHKFQTEWTPDYMMFSIDDEEIGRVTYLPKAACGSMGEFELDWPGMVNPKEGTTRAPPSYQEHIDLNVAVGWHRVLLDNAVNEGGKPGVTHPKASLDF